ncbi:hypothetical protein EXU30_08830 [Shewanella maritima]|uniref:Transporter substrate-binding domain-containing protein n=1 Tax=Shewanella maritima TaxID=2520507 RepID=A0A411PHC2_9GAMM|nr:hypothetical protein [Shewanella maritima]QBF82782.1 hypothetical protein EXU30_08830 [Shewanella maritima]
MTWLKLCCIGWLLSATLASSVFASDKVIINLPLSKQDPRYDFSHRLLELILVQTTEQYGATKLQHAPTTMTRDRTLQELKRGELVTVVPQVSLVEWQQQLIQVNFPLLKGIQGLRVFMVRKDLAPPLKDLSEQQLKQLPTGLLPYWSVYPLLKNAGFKVVDGSEYQSLFNMLNRGRFDTFSRGINEAYNELEANHQQYPNLSIDNSVLINIPILTVFYVSPKHPRLAERLEQGLLMLEQSGKLNELFYAEFCPDLMRAGIDKRRVIGINNPNLSVEFLTQARQQGRLLDPKLPLDRICQPFVR